MRIKMKPGEIITQKGDIIINQNSENFILKVSNTGDRPIQVGSHYHFAETNEFLNFDRNFAKGKRLNIPAGTAVRFEPGQSRDVNLIEIEGTKTIYGFNKKIMGSLK